jgi:hypothetical protein
MSVHFDCSAADAMPIKMVASIVPFFWDINVKIFLHKSDRCNTDITFCNALGKAMTPAQEGRLTIEWIGTSERN